MSTVKKKLVEGAASLPPMPPLPTPEEAVAQAVRRARLYLPCGRGARGKTTWSRWHLEARIGSGAKMLIADVDRINSTLSKFFPGALRPQSAEYSDVEALVRYVVESMSETGLDALMDFGGGDQFLRTIARRMDFTTWLPSIGIEPVLVHVLGAASDDLSVLADFAAAGFQPPATIIVLNEAAVPLNMTAAQAFAATIVGNPVLEAALARGARLVTMPLLDPASAIEERGLSFANTVANRVPPEGTRALGLWCAQQCREWLRAMDAGMAAAEEWLR